MVYKFYSLSSAMKKLNFGCGRDVKKGWDNADGQKGKGVISFNFDKFPYPIKANTYNYIFVNNVLEHLQDPDKVLDELWRISKPGAKIEIWVPHYTNKGAYDRLDHKHYFNETCFEYLEEDFVRLAELDPNFIPKFRIRLLEITPTEVGRFLPRSIREKLSRFINGLLSQIHVELEVVK